MVGVGIVLYLDCGCGYVHVIKFHRARHMYRHGACILVKTE